MRKGSTKGKGPAKGEGRDASMGSQKEKTGSMVIVQTRFGEFVLVDSKEIQGVSGIGKDIEDKLKKGEGGGLGKREGRYTTRSS